jgi:hypothetical protein
MYADVPLARFLAIALEQIKVADEARLSGNLSMVRTMT